MMQKYYALVQNIESDEYHIREYEKKLDLTDKKYKFYPTSNKLQCGEEVISKYTKPISFDVGETKRRYFIGEEMRHICAEIGRQVCGQCVSTLYASKDEDGNWLF